MQFQLETGLENACAAEEMSYFGIFTCWLLVNYLCSVIDFTELIQPANYVIQRLFSSLCLHSRGTNSKASRETYLTRLLSFADVSGTDSLMDEHDLTP